MAGRIIGRRVPWRFLPALLWSMLVILLAVPTTSATDGDNVSSTDVSSNTEDEDAITLAAGLEYSWGKWSMFYQQEFLYMWRDRDEDIVIRLNSQYEYYYLEFLLEGKRYNTYETGIQESHYNYFPFLDDLRRARQSIRNSVPQPILSIPGPSKFIFGNWTLSWTEEKELSIKYILAPEGTHMILRDNLPGFIFVNDAEGSKVYAKSEYTKPKNIACNKTQEMTYNAIRQLRKVKQIIKVSISNIKECNVEDKDEQDTEQDSKDMLYAAKELIKKIEQAI